MNKPEEEKTEVVEEKPQEPPKMVQVAKAFDGATAQADWGFMNLDEVMTKNTKPSDLAKKKVYVKDVEPIKSLNPRLKDPVQLRLTKDKSFSMYLFEKPNKGFSNSQKINCFMNVVL